MLALVLAVVFVVGLVLGVLIAHRPAGVADRELTAICIDMAITDAVVALSKETAADPPLLRRIVAQPFERRGLLRRS